MTRTVGCESVGYVTVAGTQVLSAGELERMRASVRPEAITDAESRRRRLKALSDEKVKTWPNTLEATRKKKENWKKEKLEEEERRRVEIDREEAEVQRAARAAAIDRAEAIMYAETDKMKMLRSKMMYSDCVHERKSQAAEKAEVAKMERARASEAHAQVVRQMDIMDAREAATKEAQQIKASAIASAQREQLEEYRRKHLARLEIAKKEGELILKRAIADAEEDEILAKEKIVREKEEMKKTLFANEELKVIKAQRAREDALEDEKIKAVVQRKEYLVKERAKLERARFDARQARKQTLIDAAARELAKIKSDEEARVERQVEEMRLKEENLEKKKQELIRLQKLAIDESRRQQLESKQRVVELEKAEVQRMMAAWKVKNDEIEAEEAEDALNRLAQNRDIRRFQEDQIKQNAVLRTKAKAIDLDWDKQLQAKLKADDARFQNTVADEIQRATSLGKPTYMLHKARLHKDITILPASGNRV